MAVQKIDWRDGGETRAQTALATIIRSQDARNKILCGFQASAGKGVDFFLKIDLANL